MPTRAIACKCGGRIVARRCDRCGRGIGGGPGKPGVRTAGRPVNNSTAKGYDRQWRNVRAAKIKANPFCENCWRRGIPRPVAEVHHKRKFRRPDGSVDRALLLAFDNLESVCRECHKDYTRAERVAAGWRL